MEEKTYDIFKMRKFGLICLYTSLIFLLLGTVSIIFYIMGVICFSGFIYFSLVFWRCPICLVRLPLRHGSLDSATYCLHCGEKMNSGIKEKDVAYDRRKVTLILGIVIIIIATTLLAMVINEHNEEKRIEQIAIQTLDILKDNKEVNEYIGSNIKILEDPMNIIDMYLIIVQGNKDIAHVWADVDENNKIKKIKISINEQKSIIVNAEN